MVSAPRLESTGSVVVAHRLKVTPQHMGSSQIRDRTHVPASAVRFFTTLSHQRSPLHTYFLTHGLHCPSILKPPTVFKPLLGSLDFVFITPLKLVIRKSPVTSQVSDPDLLISLTFAVINIPQPSWVKPKLSLQSCLCLGLSHVLFFLTFSAGSQRSPLVVRFSSSLLSLSLSAWKPHPPPRGHLIIAHYSTPPHSGETQPWALNLLSLTISGPLCPEL